MTNNVDQSRIGRESVSSVGGAVPVRPLVELGIVPFVLGILSGIVTVIADEFPVVSVFAHSLLVWIALSIALSLRRAPGRAAIRVVVMLVASVVTFYTMQQLIIYWLYADGGGFRMDYPSIVVWSLMGIVGGAVMGVVFSFLGRPDSRGVLAVMIALMLIGVQYIEFSTEVSMEFDGGVPVYALSLVLMTVWVLRIGCPTWQRLLKTLLFTTIICVPVVLIFLAVDIPIRKFL